MSRGNLENKTGIENNIEIENKTGIKHKTGIEHKIGVISDTHNKLRPEVLEKLAGCELILHGGDISKPEILEALSEIAPVHVVRGNNDLEWAEHISYTMNLDVFGVPVFMIHSIHDRRFTPLDFGSAKLVIYGHSHKYEEKDENGRHFLNPGSCGPRRFGRMNSMVLLYVCDGNFRTEYIEIPPEVKIPKKEKLPAGFAAKLPRMMYDIKHGKTVNQLMKKYGISETLANQVCRMVLTHPHVGPEGILKRLGS